MNPFSFVRIHARYGVKNGVRRRRFLHPRFCAPLMLSSPTLQDIRSIHPRSGHLARFQSTSSSDIRIAANDSDERDARRNKTERLLRQEPGSMKPPDWAVAERVFFWWVQQQESPEGVQMAWKMMDRLVLEEEQQQGASRVSTFWLFRLVDAWQTQVLRRECRDMTPENVLQKIVDYQPMVLPDAQVYSVLVDTCTKTASDPKAAAHFSQDVLHRMQRECTTNQKATPDAVMYVNVMNAWAHSGLAEAPHEAEALLKEMIGLSLLHDNKEGQESYLMAVATVLNAWANSDLPDAGERAEETLDRMEKLYGKLDAHCYGVVMAAYAKAGKGSKAEAVMERLEARYQETNDKNFKPTTVEFNSVISAYANEGNTTKAEAILRRMQHGGNQPDATSFNSVISALVSNSRNPSAAQKAEQLLQEMQQLNIQPDIVSFSSVINLLSKSNDVYAPQRAERIMRRLQKEFEDGTSGIKPNTFAFSSVIHAWTSSRAPKAAQRAESLLRWMQELHAAGDKDVKPNTVVYSSVIAAWSKSRSPKAPEKAEALLREMQERYRIGDADVKPNTVTFTCVINAHSNSRDINAAKNAEAMLLEMQKLHEGGDVDVKPNTISYNSVLAAYAKSQDPTAGQHALKYLEHMKRLQANGDEDCRPSIVTYNTVINALSTRGSASCVDKGYKLLAEAHSFADKGDRQVQPNSRTYRSLLKLIASSELQDKAERALDLLKQMKQRALEPTIFVLDEVLHCCSFVSSETDHQSTAFQIAQDTLDLIRSSRNMKARPITYVFYFQACDNAPDESTRLDALESAYQKCREDGFENNSQIRKAFASAIGQ